MKEPFRQHVCFEDSKNWDISLLSSLLIHSTMKFLDPVSAFRTHFLADKCARKMGHPWSKWSGQDNTSAITCCLNTPKQRQCGNSWREDGIN